MANCREVIGKVLTEVVYCNGELRPQDYNDGGVVRKIQVCKRCGASPTLDAEVVKERT